MKNRHAVYSYEGEKDETCKIKNNVIVVVVLYGLMRAQFQRG